MPHTEHPPSDDLSRLAVAHRVQTEFWDYRGNHTVPPAESIVAVLGALGVDARTEESVARALADAEDAPWRVTLPPVVVVRQGRDSDVVVHVPHGSEVSLEVRHGAPEERTGDLEDGPVALAQRDVYVEPREVDGGLVGRATFTVPAGLPLGWFELVAHVEGGEDAVTRLAVTPDRLGIAPMREADGRRGWGFMAQVYSTRSSRSWGIGDAADLASLTSLTGHLGGDFVLINPLHAAEVAGGMTPSPYLPTSRRFVNPIYIRPEDVRETAYLTGADAERVAELAAHAIDLARTEPQIDRDAVWAAKNEALGLVFAAGRDEMRQRELDDFRAEEGEGLENFALWCALTEKHGAEGLPEHLHDVNRPGVEAAREELSGRIDYFVWLQWVVDQQLRTAQQAATDSGMALGIMHDLAVGVHPTGADAWTMPHAFARGVTVGAPPDYYNQRGQDWSQPPWRPDALAATAYAPVRQMVRTVLRHAGALRIDHIMGFFRLWWIPAGMGPGAGAYVRYDHEAMIGVLLLEAHLADATLVGEDLGTVEPWVREFLTERGVLGTSVFWFEKDDAGNPRPSSSYREGVLATVNTHDLPPVAGYLDEEHVDLRLELGLLVDDEARARAEAREERERTAAALRAEGLLPDDGTAVDDIDRRVLIEAIHRFVARTPARLVGVSLTDAVGERRAQNQPGTNNEYPNWRVPLADGEGTPMLVDDLAGYEPLLSLVAAVRDAM